MHKEVFRTGSGNGALVLCDVHYYYLATLVATRSTHTPNVHRQVIGVTHIMMLYHLGHRKHCVGICLRHFPLPLMLLSVKHAE